MALITAGMCVLISLTQVFCLENCEQFCNGTPHTECYPPGGGDDCKNNDKEYLTTPEKRTILDFLNDKRNNVRKGLGVKSSNMMKLVWNGEMGMLAKRWADQCKEGLHDKCRTTIDGNDTGQNSYIGTFKNTKSISQQRVSERYERIVMMLNTWYSEKDLITETDINSFDINRTAAIGNVTQILWAETIYVGCGYTEFTLKDDFLLFRFVCDYKPKGNIQSHPVFKRGNPCSECSERSNCSDNYIALCFNGIPNGFTDDNEAHISRPALYTVTVFAFVALIRVLRCAVDR